MTFRLSPCIWCKWSVDICRMSWFCSPQDQGSSRGLPRMDDRSWEAAMSLAERASLHTVSQMHFGGEWQSTENHGTTWWLVFFKIFCDLKISHCCEEISDRWPRRWHGSWRQDDVFNDQRGIVLTSWPHLVRPYRKHRPFKTQLGAHF